MSIQRAIVNCRRCYSAGKRKKSTENEIYQERAMQALEAFAALMVNYSPYDRAIPMDKCFKALRLCQDCNSSAPKIDKLYKNGK